MTGQPNAKYVKIPASDGYLIHCCIWEPVGNYKSDILYLHGIQSHSGWYEESSRRLANNGYRVIFPDRRGAGLNRIQRGHLESWRLLLYDIESVLGFFGWPEKLPVLAVSWGATIACILERQRCPWLDKFVFITPGFKPYVGFNFFKKLSIASNLLLRHGLGYFPIPIPGADYFTNDKDRQEFVSKDEDTLRECTARFFEQSRKLDIMLNRTFATPTLLLLAENDRIIHNEKTIKYFKKKFIHPGNRFKIYPGYAHTLEFEDKNFNFIEDILSWWVAPAA